MFDMDTCTPTVKDEPDLIKEEKHLLPLPQERTESETKKEKKEDAPAPAAPHRPVRWRILTGICAFFCIFAVTLTGFGIAEAWGRTSTQAMLVYITNRAFLGLTTVHLTKVQEDTVPPSATIPSLPDITDFGEGTEYTPDTAENTAEHFSDTPVPDDGKEYPIIPTDLTGVSDVHTLSNETHYEPDTESLLSAPLPFLDLYSFKQKYGENEPYILIVHTHGTESFAAEGAEFYTDTDLFRSTDTEENIVAVGAVLAKALTSAGVPTLHCTEMFDAESYSDAYALSAAAIRRYLAEHPSIQIVLDVHRDSIIRTDSTKLRPVTTVNGVETAQMMFVVGTNAAGADHPYWEDNLTFALKLEDRLIKEHDRLVRPINLRRAGFNQQYTSGSLILEIGSCGNTLAEAKHAAALCAAAIAETVSERSSSLLYKNHCIFPNNVVY